MAVYYFRGHLMDWKRAAKEGWGIDFCIHVRDTLLAKVEEECYLNDDEIRDLMRALRMKKVKAVDSFSRCRV